MYIVYFRTRPEEPQASEDALRQQRTAAQAFVRGGDEIIAQFTEQEFASAGKGAVDARPQLEKALQAVLLLRTNGREAELAVLRVDAIGSGIQFVDDGAANKLADDYGVLLTFCGWTDIQFAEEVRVDYLRQKRKLERTRRRKAKRN